ncbi:peptidoglycan-binding domain-containing protein [Kitasatospora azatica]|uniref:peptidoglycan-binding domain-containing protein n=1 Tax=Kitasatospora azatica TaxID=58347 RepID=UPI00055ADA7B|nr:peptidoglycan-binding domain-containing protein [Kitasatospora azatica]
MPGFDQPGHGPDPDVTETAVLPHVEGPPLVRPYVAAPATGVEQDPFGTTVLPPMPAAPPAARTTALLPPAPPSAPPRELGLFPISTDPAPTGRAAARKTKHRRQGLIAAAGAGVVLLGVSLAFAVSPGADSNRQALPVLPTGAPEPTPSSQPSSAAASASPASARPASSAPATSARPTTAAPKPKPSPTTAAAPPPPSASPTPPAPTTQAPPTSAPPSPSPSPSATPRTLQYKDTGPDVANLQEQLFAVGCFDSNFTSGTYDKATRQAVGNFQNWNALWQEPWGVYTPATRTALTSGKSC